MVFFGRHGVFVGAYWFCGVHSREVSRGFLVYFGVFWISGGGFLVQNGMFFGTNWDCFGRHQVQVPGIINTPSLPSRTATHASPPTEVPIPHRRKGHGHRKYGDQKKEYSVFNDCFVAVDVPMLVSCCLPAPLAPLVLISFWKTKGKAQSTFQVGHKSRILYFTHEGLSSQRDRCTKYLQQRIKL